MNWAACCLGCTTRAWKSQGHCLCRGTGQLCMLQEGWGSAVMSLVLGLAGLGSFMWRHNLCCILIAYCEITQNLEYL